MNHAVKAAALGAFVLAGGATIAVAYADWSGRALNRETLCPLNQPVARTVAILVDETDPRDKRHAEVFTTALAALIATAPDGTRFTIQQLTPDADRSAGLLYARCKPPVATSWFAGNPWLDGRRYHERFLSPLEAATAQALATRTTSNSSPLVEAVHAIAGDTAFRDAAAQTLVVFSDLMEFNQPFADFYQQVPSYPDFAQHHQGYFDLDLSRAEVVVVQTPAISKLPAVILAQRQAAAVQFWRDYFAAAHAAEVTIKPL